MILSFGFAYLFWMIFLLFSFKRIETKNLLGVIIPFVGLTWFAAIWINLVAKHVFVGVIVTFVAWLLGLLVLCVKKLTSK